MTNLKPAIKWSIIEVWESKNPTELILIILDEWNLTVQIGDKTMLILPLDMFSKIAKYNRDIYLLFVFGTYLSQIFMLLNFSLQWKP